VWIVNKIKAEKFKWKKNKEGCGRNWILRRNDKGVHTKLLKEINIENTAAYENVIQMSRNYQYRKYFDLVKRINTKN